MHFRNYRAGYWSVLVFIILGIQSFSPANQAAKDRLRNRPELSLPLTDKKLVMAHCMTNIIRYKGHKLEDSCNPDYYSPDDNVTSSLGGLTQVKVMADQYLSEATLDEAVEFEMRTAIASGIDGFQFYYTMGNSSWDEIIKAYLHVATAKNIDFKFTFCISHPSGSNEAIRIDEFSRRMNEILNDAGRNNPHWLRTPDGRLIIYMWYGEGLADIPENLNGYSEQYYMANAYKKLGDAIKENLSCIVSINEQITTEKLNRYLDYFPAVWLWTLPYTDNYIGKMVATECKKRKRIFTGSAFPDFYTSKLLKKGTWDMFHFVDDAVKAGIKGTERKYIVTGLSYNFRKQLEFAIDKDVSLINIITWNDYPEGHHLAPEINHNNGFNLLLQYYKSVWKKEPNPFGDEPVIVAFYKKYNHTITPSPFAIPVVEIEKPGVSRNVEDSVEVVTICTKPASVNFNGATINVDAGLQASRFAATAGSVAITVQQNDGKTQKLVCPEWITDKPYRTDRLTYTYSNLTVPFYKKLFGDSGTVMDSKEYDPAAGSNKINLYKSR